MRDFKSQMDYDAGLISALSEDNKRLREANGPSDTVAKRVANSIFKANGYPGVMTLDINELATALEYAIDIYSGNAAKVFAVKGGL